MCVYLTLPYLTWYVRTLSVHNASLIYWKFIQPLKTAGIGLTHSTGPINAALLYLLTLVHSHHSLQSVAGIKKAGTVGARTVS